ncbi:MAG: hypothetical protein V1770_04980 [bacterium]
MAKKDIGKIVLLFVLIVFLLSIVNSASKSTNIDPALKNLIPNIINSLLKEVWKGVNLKIILTSALIIFVLASIRYLNTK